MRRLGLVALYEYRRHVSRGSFVMLLLSMPLLVAFSVGIGYLMGSLENNSDAVGYVDLAGLLADPIPAPRSGSSPNDVGDPRAVPLIAFATEEEARAALEAGDIQAYYVVTADYMETNRVELVYIKPPGDNVGGQFWDFMQINWLWDLPPEIAHRAVAGSNLIIRWPTDTPGGGREFSEETFLNSLLPIFMGIGFLMLFFSSAGYLMQAVAEEKENLTVEVLVTSVSPGQLMAGKIAGILGIASTQIAVWIAFAGLAIFVGGRILGISVLTHLQIDWGIVAKVIVVALPTFTMVAGLMTALGAVMSKVQESQQVMGLLVQPIVVPFWLLKHIMENPGSALTIGLSLFPLTALTTFCLRLAFMPVPTWQVAVSASLLAVCAVGTVWLAGRAFRLGMLRYGQRVRWRELFGLERNNG